MNIEIGHKLKQLNVMLSELDSVYQSLLKANNVSDSEYIVMLYIQELGEGCSQKDIADNSLISKKTVNSTIKKFEKDGYIELVAAKYPHMKIFLTDKGREFFQNCIMPIIELENDVLENMTENEFEFLSTFYKIYIKGFKSRVDSFVRNKKIQSAKQEKEKQLVTC